MAVAFVSGGFSGSGQVTLNEIFNPTGNSGAENNIYGDRKHGSVRYNHLPHGSATAVC
ncbi:MAG: hypothetical protein U1F16_08155 [Turneriella sp.]